MKKIVLFVFTLAVSIITNAQVQFMDYNIYLIGHEDFEEYPIKIRINTDTRTSVTLENGEKCLPALTSYLKHREHYVGGLLVNTTSGDTTEITSIDFKCLNEEDCFWVYGENFSNNFNLNNGYILYESGKKSVFYNKEDDVIFTIQKRNF